MKLRAWAAALLLFLMAAGPLAAQGSHDVDLELVLAVDASSSVSEEEFDLQMRGLAEAFRHPALASAIEAAGDLGIAVSLIQWADNRNQRLAVDWWPVSDAAEAVRLANEIDATPRFLIGGGTAIGGAIEFSVKQLQNNGFAGRRKVIDISGDGRANQGIAPSRLRDEAVAQGVTINGLAIVNEDPLIDGYYLHYVIGGTGAFVMSATDYEDFQQAILTKLIREIAGAPLAGGPGRPAGTGQLADRD